VDRAKLGTMAARALRWAGAAVVVLIAAATVVPRASANPPSRDHVRQMLSGFETVPGADAWRTLGPETLGVLVGLYDDAHEVPFVRLRAVTVAAYYPSPAARTFLLAVARARGQSDLFVREAVLALGRAFGARALDDVRPFLAHAEPTVREAAAMALARIGTRPALDAVRTRLRAEPDAAVRDTMTRALRPLHAASAAASPTPAPPSAH